MSHELRMQKCRMGRTFLAASTLRIENPADLEGSRFKIQQKPHAEMRGTKVRPDLGIVNASERLDRLELHYNLITNQKIKAMLADRMTPELHTYPEFSCVRDRGLPEGSCKRLGIQRLQEAWAERPMHFDSASYDPPR